MYRARSVRQTPAFLSAVRYKRMLVLNTVIISVIFDLNYFYQSNGFDFTLKCIYSGAFALLGLINLYFALIAKQQNIRFFIAMFAGLLLAFAMYVKTRTFNKDGLK